jgi:HAE1 family hydrophobic/amphiphilic exporter-1
LGTAVFGGLLVATLLSLLVVPVLYVVIKNLEGIFLKDKTEPPKPPTPPSPSTQSEQEPSPDRRSEPKQRETIQKIQGESSI